MLKILHPGSGLIFSSIWLSPSPLLRLPFPFLSPSLPCRKIFMEHFGPFIFWNHKYKLSAWSIVLLQEVERARWLIPLPKNINIPFSNLKVFQFGMVMEEELVEEVAMLKSVSEKIFIFTQPTHERVFACLKGIAIQGPHSLSLPSVSWDIMPHPSQDYLFWELFSGWSCWCGCSTTNSF